MTATVTLSLAFLLGTLCAGCSSAPQGGPFAQELQRLAEREGLPSLVVGILADGKLGRRVLVGRPNRLNAAPASPETIYYLASISKVFTAVAVLQLVERGQLDLDADVGSYLPFAVRNPSFPDEVITTRMLLGHRSSLADKNYEVFSGQTAPPMYPAIEHILVPGVNPRYEADVWRNAKPGSDYLYSNVTTAVLGYLVEVVSGQDYNEYCKRNIFEPLGMSQTSHRLDDLDESMIARAYVGGRDVGFYSTELYPSGMLKSTLNDLGRFAAALLGGGELEGSRILQQASADEMFTLHHPGSSPIGYIWYRYASLGGVWGHAGWFRGYQTMLMLDRDKGVAAIILSNSSTPPGNPILFDGEITKLVNREMLK